MGVVQQARYRLWQFWIWVQNPDLSKTQRMEIASILNPDEIALFYRQDVGGQHHAYRVAQAIIAQGDHSDELLKAALLHDVGKSRMGVAWWDRPVVVLGEALFPNRTKEWSRGSPDSWKRPFVVKANHALWGAEDAAAAGSPTITVELIRWHQTAAASITESQAPVESEALTVKFTRFLDLLQQADGIN